MKSTDHGTQEVSGIQIAMNDLDGKPNEIVFDHHLYSEEKMEGVYISIFKDGSYRVKAPLNDFYPGPHLQFESDGNIKFKDKKVGNVETEERLVNDTANGQVEVFKVNKMTNYEIEHDFAADGTPNKSIYREMRMD